MAPGPKTLLGSAQFTQNVPLRNTSLTTPALEWSAGRGQLGMISGIQRHVRYGSGSAWTFAVKVIGVGIFAGLVLTYCNVLLDACMSGIR
jgi:hypothetical protein